MTAEPVTVPLLNADQPPQSPYQWEQWWLHVTRKADSRQLSHPPRETWPCRR